MYIKAAAEKRWRERKEAEEKILRDLHCPEEIILRLRHYDWEEFKRERRYGEHELSFDPEFFVYQPAARKKRYKTAQELLDDVSDLEILDYLQKADPSLLRIILLISNGYKIKEIAKILNIPLKTVYKRIKKFSNMLPGKD